MEQPQQPITKRKRQLIACNVCRHKKIKCDGQKPCSKCVKFNLHCSYSSIIRKRGPKQSHIDVLEQRIRKLEEMIESNNNIPSQSCSLTENVSQALPSYNTTTTTTTTTTQLNEWPSDDIIEDALDIYFNQCELLLSPIVDIEAFQESVKNKTCSSFLLHSILSVAVRFLKRSDIIESPLWLSGEKYAIKARSMIANVIESPNIEHIQGLIYLSLYEYGCARGPHYWRDLGIAICMTLELGLNKEIMFEEIMPGMTMSLNQWLWYESRRKLYWTVFINDKVASAYSGRPQMLDSRDADILLPISYHRSILDDSNELYQKSIDGRRLIRYNIIRENRRITGVQMIPIDLSMSTRTIESIQTIGIESHIIKQYTILDKIIHFINRGAKDLTQKDTHTFKELNRELDDIWQERLLSDEKGFSYHYSLLLQNGLIVLLNRVSLVLASNMPRLEEVTQEMQELIYKSQERCLSAAYRFSTLLKDVVHNFKTATIPPYFIYFAYVVATVMVNHSFSINPEECEKAEDALKEMLTFFHEMKLYWAMSEKMDFLTKDLYALHERVMDLYQRNSQDQHMTEENHDGDTTVTAKTLSPSAHMESNDDWSSLVNGTTSSMLPVNHLLFDNNNSTSSLNAISSFDIWLQQQIKK
ncbi:fungal-specific transcription factor domain-containing protein [Cokeromyces recurvatus]|uniref:fungal-specific transcription factor domain-containing protein n=1 Tax=Cokeromyces recurvatus TaxID=90255 RepID=UPI00221F9637|nr:fungal-specific transcription factor domain-containing protein [Cokeromyces recurvatus]KAI7906145.1 fungal-specific transcription factor domain-containing protein [Cokeromyces recurvatus]